MRVQSTTVVAVGETRTVFGVTIQRHAERDWDFTFPVSPDATTIGNVNAALGAKNSNSPDPLVGIAVGAYWRWKAENQSVPDSHPTTVSLYAGGARVYALGPVSVRGGVAYQGITTPHTRPVAIPTSVEPDTSMPSYITDTASRAAWMAANPLPEPEPEPEVEVEPLDEPPLLGTTDPEPEPEPVTRPIPTALPGVSGGTVTTWPSTPSASSAPATPSWARPVAPAPVAAPAPQPVVQSPPVNFGVITPPLVVQTTAEAVEADTVAPEDEYTETVPDDVLATGHRYRPAQVLIDLWDASERGVANGELPDVFAFIGPSGSGKTEAAQFLAVRSGLPYWKEDAYTHTDIESWFGLRDVIADPVSGASITVYTPSEFVLALQRPGVIYIDEFTRVMDKIRVIVLGLIDGTRRVSNPLTGEMIQVHPEARIIMGGNVGLNFSGTYQVDPAFWTRVATVEFEYVTETVESELLVEGVGLDKRQADALASFASKVRVMVKAMQDKGDADLEPVSTRQLFLAARLIKQGADIDNAAAAHFWSFVSNDGGPLSLRQKLITTFAGIRPLFDPEPEPVEAEEVVSEPDQFGN